jgi:crotonobetainyl-CoA:carnitine CoA-transferase CaiB-like acyl-CoA transferase
MQAKVPAGPVNSVDDIARDPELLARGLLYTAETGGRRVPQVGLGIGIDGANATYRSPPPKLGEHTASILRDWLGYDMQAVAALRLQKLI